MRTFFDFDSKLRHLKHEDGTPHIFKRFTSLSALPFDWTKCKSEIDPKQIKHYEELIRKSLVSKFAIPTLARSDFGQLVNVDEALDGIPECYRHTRPIKSILKLGLNISADFSSTPELFAMRAAAIIAVFSLAKSRGQKVQFDVCYGYFGFPVRKVYKESAGHIRVSIQTPSIEIIKKVMSEAFWDEMIKVSQSLCGNAAYRLYKFKELYPALPPEFDFALDRIETSDPEIEYQRILDQIKLLQ